MSGTNRWRYIGVVMLVVLVMLCVSAYLTQFKGYIKQDNENLMALQKTLQKIEEQMIASEQKVSDMAKSMSEVKSKVEAPVRIEKVKKQVFYLLTIFSYSCFCPFYKML